MKPVSRRAFLRSAGSGALTAVAAGVYGRVSTHWLECNEYTFALPRWTKEKFRVAYFSDSHLTDETAVDVTQRALAYAIAQKPDLIAYGGDFVENSKPDGSMERMAEAFAALASCGIPAVTVFGNHDYATFHPQRVFQLAHDLGFVTLRNQPFEIDGVTVFGLDCLTFQQCRFETLQRIEARENVLVLLHEPDGADRLPDFPSLMLAGHSHGGQICLPTGYPITTPLGARKYRKGFYPDLRVPTFVSRGLGETGVRLRLFCRPEASILTLVPAGAA